MEGGENAEIVEMMKETRRSSKSEGNGRLDVILLALIVFLSRVSIMSSWLRAEGGGRRMVEEKSLVVDVLFKGTS